MKTACVILNYQNAAATLNAVQSVRRSTGCLPQIYVVDNNSNEHTRTTLRQASTSGGFVLLANEINKGYAGGMNTGLRRALDDGADFVWLITQDVTVHPSTLQTLLDLWQGLERPGMLGSLTVLNDSDRVYFYKAHIENGNVRHRTKGRTASEIPELRADLGPTDYVNGSCILTHRDVIDKVGLIPEDYFMYFEDCEWGLRAARMGFKNYVSYKTRVHHWRDQTSFNENAEYYCRRNSFLFKKRNGFTKPWTKSLEILKVMKYYLKARLRIFLKPNDTQLRSFAAVLSEVSKDLRQEKYGKRGPHGIHRM